MSANDWVLDTAQQIAAECKSSRKRAGPYSMAELAKRADVSTRMIVRLENRDQLAVVIRASRDSERQKKALARILAQVAAALSRDPREWIERARLGLRDSQLSLIISKAVQRQRGAAKALAVSVTRGETAPRIQSQLLGDRLKKQNTEPVKLNGAMVAYWPFAERRDEGQPPSFLEEITRCLVGSIHYECEVKWEVVENYSDRLNGGDDLLTGFLQQLQREFAYGLWRIETIPGFLIRTAFLTLRKWGHLSWREILDPRCDLGPVRLIVLKDSVAENLLRGVCGLSRRVGDPVEMDYDLDVIAEEVGKRLGGGKPSVFVADQCTTYRVQGKLRDLDLIDLVVGPDEAAVPAYPLGIMTRSDDHAFSELIGRIFREELYDSHAVVAARVYANYLVGTFEKIDQLVEDATEFAKEFATGASTAFALPSFLRVVNDPRWTFPAVFTDCLREEISSRLSKLINLKGRVLESVVRAFLPPPGDDARRVI